MHPFLRNAIYNSAKTIGKPFGLYPFPRSYRRHLLDLLERLQINCVLDVGAHYGEWGQILRGIGYQGRILSFEPVGASFQRLQQNAASDSQWHVFPFALGAEDTTAKIHLYKASDLNSFFEAGAHVNDRFAHHVDDMGYESVAIRKLDSVFDELDLGSAPSIYLKMDTQGYDKYVVQGGAESLRYVAAMQSELPGVRPLHPDEPDMLEALAYYRHLGYAPTGFFPLNFELDKTTVIEFDVVLTRFAN